MPHFSLHQQLCVSWRIAVSLMLLFTYRRNREWLLGSESAWGKKNTFVSFFENFFLPNLCSKFPKGTANVTIPDNLLAQWGPNSTILSLHQLRKAPVLWRNHQLHAKPRNTAFIWLGLDKSDWKWNPEWHHCRYCQLNTDKSSSCLNFTTPGNTRRPEGE